MIILEKMSHQYLIFQKYKEILKEKQPSFSLGKCQRALRKYFSETTTQSYKHLYETIKIYEHEKRVDQDEPSLKIFISLSPQIHPHVRVAFDIFNHLVYVTLKYKLETIYSKHDEVYEEISRLALINFLDDESLKQNANKLMFNSLKEIKEAFCGLWFFKFLESFILKCFSLIYRWQIPLDREFFKSK